MYETVWITYRVSRMFSGIPGSILSYHAGCVSLWWLWTLCSHAETTAAPLFLKTKTHSITRRLSCDLWSVGKQHVWEWRCGAICDSGWGLHSVEHCWTCETWYLLTVYPQVCLKDNATADGRHCIFKELQAKQTGYKMTFMLQVTTYIWLKASLKHERKVVAVF